MSGPVDRTIEILIMISSGVFSLFFLTKCNIVKIKTICFLLAHLNSSSLNAEKKFRGLPHLLHMCVILFNLPPVLGLVEFIYLPIQLWIHICTLIFPINFICYSGKNWIYLNFSWQKELKINHNNLSKVSWKVHHWPLLQRRLTESL